MSGKRSHIIDQLTILIMCFMTAIPTAWLLESYWPNIISMEYFVSYFVVLFSMSVVLSAIDHEKMIYQAAILMPVVIIVVFRDTELFVNGFAAFVFFLILLPGYSGSRRRELMSVVTLIIALMCGYKGGVPRVTAVMLIGLAVLSIAGYTTMHLKYALTLVVAIECIVMLINTDVRPLLWKPLASRIDKIWSVVDSAFKDTEYRFGAYNSVSYTGYGEPGGMFSGVEYRYREELSADVVGKITMIYLKGASYTDVTQKGISGKVVESVSDNSWFAMYLNSLYNAGITREEARSFSKLLKVNVEYEYMQTEDVMRSSNLLTIDEEGSEKELSKNHRYSYNYVAMDYANPYLDEVVRGEDFSNRNGMRINDVPGTGMAYDYFYHLKLQAKNDGDDNSRENAVSSDINAFSDKKEIPHLPYFVIKDYAYKLYNIKLEDIMDESAYEQAFEQYERDRTDERYLEDSLVTDRIRYLSEEVTKNCTSDYDKARSIEAFLRQYTYDTKVDLRNRDNFVESFLFEEQSGYCVHYATAMVEMLRSIGIPARYTQGYRHITDKGELIYSNEAHAWPEAFIEGMGWISFEPTVIFVSATEAGWGLRPQGENDDKREDDLVLYDPTTAVPPSDVETQQKKAAGTGDDTAAISEDGDDSENFMMNIARRVGAYILAIAGVLFFVILLYRLYEIIRYNRMPIHEKILADIAAISRKCDKKFIEDEQALSVFDYIPYIKQKRTEYDLNELFGEYYRVRFRGDEPTKEFAAKLHELAKGL